MNHGAQICRLLLDNGATNIDALCDRVGLDGKTCYALIGNLSRNGILKWDTRSDFVSVLKPARARELAEKTTSPSTDPEPPATPAPAPSSTKSKKFLRDLVPTAIAIEKGVPVPPPGTGQRASTWPFDKMEIGDSFAVEAPPGMTMSALVWRLRSAAERWARKYHPAFRATTRMSEDGKSVRLWRAPDAPGSPPVGNGNGNATLAPQLDPALAARTPSSLGIRARKKGGK